MIVPLEEETAKKIQDEEITSIQVRIDKDSQKMVADLSVIEKTVLIMDAWILIIP